MNLQLRKHLTFIETCLLVVLFFICIPYLSSAQEDSSLDIVQIIDRSGSVKQNDPNGQLSAAARFLLDILPLYGYNSKGAVVYFGDGVIENWSNDKLEPYDVLKRTLDNIPPANENWTCYPDAFQHAVKRLESSTAAYKHIYLFTDGEGTCFRYYKNFSGNKKAMRRELIKDMSNQVIPELVKNNIRVYVIFLNKQKKVEDVEELGETIIKTRGEAFNVRRPEEILEVVKKIISLNERIVVIDQQENDKNEEIKQFVFEIPNKYSMIRIAVTDPKARFANKDKYPIELITPNGSDVGGQGNFILTAPEIGKSSKISTWAYIGKAIPGKWQLTLNKNIRPYEKMILYVDGYTRVVPEIEIIPDSNEFEWGQETEIRAILKDPNDQSGALITPSKVEGYILLPSGQKEMLMFKNGVANYKIPSLNGSCNIELSVFADRSQKKGFPIQRRISLREPNPIELVLDKKVLDFGSFTPCADSRVGDIKISYNGDDRGAVPLKVKWSTLPNQNGRNYIDQRWFSFSGREIKVGIASVNQIYGTVPKAGQIFQMSINYLGIIYNDIVPGQYTGELQIYYSDNEEFSKTVKVVCEIKVPNLILSPNREELDFNFWWNANKYIKLKKSISVKTDNPHLVRECKTGFDINMPLFLNSTQKGHHTNLRITEIKGGVKDENVLNWFKEQGNFWENIKNIPLSTEKVILSIEAEPIEIKGQDFDRSDTRVGKINVRAPITGKEIVKEIKASYGILEIWGKKRYGLEFAIWFLIIIGLYILLSYLFYWYPTLKRQSRFATGSRFSKIMEPGKVWNFLGGQTASKSPNQEVLPSNLIPMRLFVIRYSPDIENENKLVVAIPESAKNFVNISGGNEVLKSDSQCEIEIYNKDDKRKPYFVLEIDHIENGEAEVNIQESPFRTKTYANNLLFKRVVLIPVIFSILIFGILPSTWLANFMNSLSLSNIFIIFSGEFIPFFKTIFSIFIILLSIWGITKLFRKIFGPIKSII